MDERRVPWLNLWMIFFGVVAMWLMVPNFLHHRFRDAVSWTDFIFAFLMLGAVVLVGIVRMPNLSQDVPTLDEIGGVYLRAWKQLWRRKWILRLFGLVAGLNLLGAMVGVLLLPNYLRSGNMPINNPLQRCLSLLAPWQLMRTVLHSTSYFFPRSGISSNIYPTTALILLVLLPWLLKRIGRIRSELPAEAQFVRMALISAGIIALAELALSTRHYISAYQMVPRPFHASLSQAFSAARTNLHVNIQNQPRLPYYAWELAVGCIFTPVILGGLIGSLRAGGRVTVDSFLSNSVRYFKPIAGIRLLMTLWLDVFQWGAYPHWPIGLRQVFASLDQLAAVAVLLIIFAPIIAVMQDSGWWTSVKASMAHWRLHLWQIVSFAAVGITFLAVVLTFNYLLGAVSIGSYWVTLALLPVRVVVEILMIAVMLLAVWEFYKLIQGDQEVSDA